MSIFRIHFDGNKKA
ncbi:hypothetical protein ACVS8G_002188 [Escherichia coli]|nr:hypothetical protein [Escherichia coli]MCJ2881022.1 hypothetical protein [Escherichia coli]MCV8850147.1 hypothetical protein [Escherichia coli]WGC31787.1 hypothetical protein NFL63_12845 [Escherichia coli]